jgi:hypothetical protein|tara:strand:+ start:1051 stop:1527 length:477 start_codon:yes stop_codon:yes gene_type:complete
MEAEFGGVKFKGGKIFGLLIALGTLVGGLYGGFVAYKDYQDMKETMLNYTAPDLSGFDKRIDLVQQEIEMISGEMSMMLSEIELVAGVATELKNDLKTDIRQMEQDNRHIESMVDSIKNKTREELRLFEDSIKELEADLVLRIQKALENPLNNMAVVK